MKHHKPSGSPAIPFPPAWLWFVDEALPDWVKQHYSPKESWKEKPFSSLDASFFLKGIQELSEIFTEERPKKLPSYFNHPRFRSAYLLYFLPLQAAKFLALFELHPKAAHLAAEGQPARIVDLGAGPGTASIALLLWLLKQPGPIPPIEFEWWDTNRHILEDGKSIVETIANNFPKLRGKVTVHTHVGNWWEAAKALPSDTRLVLMGHVLNEAPAPRPKAFVSDLSDDEEEQTRPSPLVENLSALYQKCPKGAGIIFLEPATHRAAQLLAQSRDGLIEAKTIKASPASIWGPCLHAGPCPLSHGRDWCHFSIPTEVPGKWFKFFSKGLGSERQWIKFTYLWLSSKNSPAPVPVVDQRRVVSDSLEKHAAHGSVVLVCEPSQTRRITLSSRVFRGDLIRMHEQPRPVKFKKY